MCQALVFGIELLPFVCSRGQFVHFGNLPLQTLALLLALGLALTGRFELLLTGAPVLPVLADGVGCDAAIAVEQGAHAAGLHQPLPGMLAMDIDQQGAQRAQLGGSGGSAVDPATALALAVDRAAQQDLILIGINTVFFQ